MFLATKLNLLSGMIIGASAVLLMKEMCKRRCKQKRNHEHKHGTHPMEPEQERAVQTDINETLFVKWVTIG